MLSPQPFLGVQLLERGRNIDRHVPPSERMEQGTLISVKYIHSALCHSPMHNLKKFLGDV